MKTTWAVLASLASAFGSLSAALACQPIAAPAGCDVYVNDPLAHARCIRTAAAGIQLGGNGTLANGNLFFVGGVDSSGNRIVYTSKRAFVYDLQTKSLCETAPMITGRNQGIPVQAMADGRVLVSGGWTSYGATKYAEVYDPRSETWQKVGSLPVALYEHATRLQPDGNILISGGYVPNKGRNNGATPNANTYLFDAVRSLFSAQ